MQKCAYCGNSNPITKEHLLPKCLHTRTGDYDVQLLQVAPQKLVGGEPTIRDVCSECNNGVLSELDAYFCSLYDRHFIKFVQINESVNFYYNFDQLTRWFLKVAYNSARAHKSDDVSLLSNCTKYILTGQSQPRGLTVFVRLIIPYRVKIRQKTGLVSSVQGEIEAKPEVIRISRAYHPSYSSRFGLFRMIGVNSFHFYIVLPPKGIRKKLWRESLQAFQIEGAPGSQKLKPNQSKIVLYSSEVDAMRVAEHHYLDNWNVYQKWRETNKKSG